MKHSLWCVGMMMMMKMKVEMKMKMKMLERPLLPGGGTYVCVCGMTAHLLPHKKHNVNSPEMVSFGGGICLANAVVST